jgi:hypothetical protein
MAGAAALVIVIVNPVAVVIVPTAGTWLAT